MNKEKLKADIFEWLFTHHDAYDSPQEWREGYAKFLNEKIDRAFESEATVSGSIRLGRVMDTSDLPTPYPVKVDYSKSLKQMIKAGKYDWVNENINEKNFPTYLTEPAKTQKDIYLMGYDESITSEQLEEHLDEKGLRACTLPELLALGDQYPELQRKNYIFALGSRWRDPNDDVYVLVLYEINGRRELDLRWCEDRWDRHCRFAAVAK